MCKKHTHKDNTPKFNGAKSNKTKETSMPNNHTHNTYENCNINHAPELDECKSRLRRWRQFIIMTELIEITDIGSVKHKSIVDIMKQSGCGMTDHCTYLQCRFKACVLMEPYNVDFAKFPHDKLIYIKLPERIAPYGGGILFDDNGDAVSGTSSYLVTTKINARFLEEIERRLVEAASKMPPFDYFDED